MSNKSVLANNEETEVNAGLYIFKATGALDVQVQLDEEGFNNITDGSFTGVTTGTIRLSGEIKVVNAGANLFYFRLAEVQP